jgi:protein TonB
MLGDSRVRAVRFRFGGWGLSAAAAELARCLRERPFRVALGVSLLAHVALLSVLAAKGVRTMPPSVRVMEVRALRFVRELAEAPPADRAEPSPAPVPPRRRESAPAVSPAAPGALPAVPAPVAPDAPEVAASPAPPAAPPQVLPDPPPPTPVTADQVAASAVTGSPAAETAGVSDGVPDAAPEGVAAAAPRVDVAARSGGPPVLPAGTSVGSVGGAAPASDTGGGVASGVASPGSGASSPGESAPGRPLTSEELARLRSRIDARKVYPQIAVRNGWEGEVVVELELGLGGNLEDVRLVRGSGYPILDKATIVAVRRAAPYPPLEGRVTVPVDYRLVP